MMMSVPSIDALDVLCPMHVCVNQTGHITHVGPTLRKIRPGKPWIGQRVLEVLRVMRPREVMNMEELARIFGEKLHLELRDAPGTGLKGVAMPMAEGGAILNLAFGISILDAVRDFNLSNADFAATDLTVEMLYLVEAKSAAMEASRKLNLRLQGAKLAAEEQAVTDTLTGLKNRRAMDAALARFIEMRTPFALMHIDLDYFKAVNDTLGHAAGDHVLLSVAGTFRRMTRAGDVIARMGGDEFVILMPNRIDRTALAQVGKRIIAALEIPTEFNGQCCRISGSIGTVIWDGDSEAEPDQLMDDADVALYASKNAGRAQQTIYEEALRT